MMVASGAWGEKGSWRRDDDRQACREEAPVIETVIYSFTVMVMMIYAFSIAVLTKRIVKVKLCKKAPSLLLFDEYFSLYKEKVE